MAKKKKQLKKEKQLIEEGFIIDNEKYKNVSDSRIKSIIIWLREGKTDYEILSLILELFKVKETSAKTYLMSAKACFKQEMILERKFNVIQHVKRYDRDILKLSHYQPKTNSYSQSIVLKTQAYLDMISLLQKKEKVLGFHQKNNILKIKNNFNIKLKPLKKIFYFDDFSIEEKIELFHLIEKTKIQDDEKYVIKAREHKKSEQIIDIDHQEIKQENINIDLIKNKKEEIEQIEIPNIGMDKNVIDTIDKKNKKDSNLDSIKNSLLNNLLKQK